MPPFEIAKLVSSATLVYTKRSFTITQNSSKLIQAIKDIVLQYVSHLLNKTGLFIAYNPVRNHNQDTNYIDSGKNTLKHKLCHRKVLWHCCFHTNAP
jgi:hypothetical protein